MGSLKRKMQRKKSLKKAKDAKKSLKRALNATMGIPTSCSSCNTDFNPETDSESWMVSIYEKDVILSCPNCFEEKTE